MRRRLALMALLVPVLASARVEVRLASGRTVDGERVERTGGEVILFTDAGTIRFKESQVASVREIAEASAGRGFNVVAPPEAAVPREIPAERSAAGHGRAWMRLPAVARLVRAGSLEAAESALRALAINAPDDVPRVALGEVLVLRGRHAQAADVLGSMPGLAEDLRLAHALALAEALARLDRVDQARAVLARAPPDASGAVAALEAELDADAAGAGGTTSASPHFIVHALPDSSRSDVEALLARLESVHAELLATLGDEPRERIVVLLYPGEAFWEATGQGRSVGGLYDGKVRVPAGRLAGLDALLPTLRHEVAHAFVDALSGGRADACWQEGFAEHVEGADERPRRQALAAALRANPDAWPPGCAHAPAHVRMEWFLGRFGMGPLREVLAGLATQGTIDRALKAAVGLTAAELDEAWRLDLLAGAPR